MKHLILVLLLSLLFTSCTKNITVVDIKTGRTLRVMDRYQVSKHNDTLVLRHTNSGTQVYGVFIDTLPESSKIMRKDRDGREYTFYSYYTKVYVQRN